MRRYVVLRDRVDEDRVAAAMLTDESPLRDDAVTTHHQAVGALRKLVLDVTGHPLRVTVLDEPDAHAQYVTVEGDDAALVERVASDLERALPSVSHDELLATARTEYAHDPASLLRAVLASDESREDPQLVALLDDAAGDDSAAVRRYAYHAAGFTRWPSGIALVRHAAEYEPDPDVRAHARRVLASLVQTGLVSEGDAPWQD